MRYLIVNHIAAGRGRDAAHLRLPRPWARDLAASARACKSAGVDLVVATPVTPTVAGEAIECTPDDFGFEHVELPAYHNARSFLAVRDELATALQQTIATADVVQLDHGGHPIPLGVFADPIAQHLNVRRLWTIAGDRLPDPRLANTARTAARRLVGRPVDARVRRVWADALRSADAIVTHDLNVTHDLHRTLGIASTPVHAIDALDSDCTTTETLVIRRARITDVTRPLRLVVAGDQTIGRGTDHVLRAMQRCRRLGVKLELLIVGTGSEAAAFAKLAGELNLGPAVTFTSDPAQIGSADVFVDAALTDRARLDLARPLAAGLAPIGYAATIDSVGIVNVARNDLDALTAALFDAAIRRDTTVARMLRGVAWARERTLDVAHRRRIDLARLISARDQRAA